MPGIDWLTGHPITQALAGMTRHEDEGGMVARVKLIVHGDNFNVEMPFETELDAEAEAFQLISRGIRSGNRIYPNQSILYCEIVKEG